MAERHRDAEADTTRGDVRREFDERTAAERMAAERMAADQPPMADPAASKRWTMPIAWIVTLIVVAILILAYAVVF